MIYQWAIKVLFFAASLSVSSEVFAVAGSDSSAEQRSVSRMQVVTTFSILADLVQQIGGDYITVNTLVDWDEDAHVYHPTPSDVRHLAKAELLVLNGLGFEGWLERLISASKFKGQLVTAAHGINVITLNVGETHAEHHGHAEHHEHGQQGVDPHAWHSLSAVKIYIQNITAALSQLDRQHQSYYQSNAAQYLVELDRLEKDTREKLSSLNDLQRNIVMPHNAFAYLARDYNLHVYSLKGVNSESEASAAQIAQVIRKIKAKNIRAVFTETTADDRLINLVKQETGALMGGALISGALSKKLAPTYLDMMRYNIDRLTQALVYSE